MTSKVEQASNKARQLILARLRSKFKAKRRPKKKKSQNTVVAINVPGPPITTMEIKLDSEEVESTTIYDGGTKTIKSLCDGNLIVVSSKASEALRVPLFCPLCELPMKTQDDSNTYKTVGCCWPCDLNWRSNPQFSLGISEFKKFIEVDDKWHSYLTKRSDELKKLVNLR